MIKLFNLNQLVVYLGYLKNDKSILLDIISKAIEDNGFKLDVRHPEMTESGIGRIIYEEVFPIIELEMAGLPEMEVKDIRFIGGMNISMILNRMK